MFSLIIVFLSFFSTYVFQVSTNTRNSPPASQYYIVMNVCRLGWWGCWWPGTSCPSWCRWPTSASPSATTWPRSTRAGTSPSPTGGQISSSRSSSSTDQVESSTLQFFYQYLYACLVSKWLCPDCLKLRQGSGKDRQGMALKAKGLKLKPLPRAYIKVGCQLS